MRQGQLSAALEREQALSIDLQDMKCKDTKYDLIKLSLNNCLNNYIIWSPIRTLLDSKKILNDFKWS